MQIAEILEKTGQTETMVLREHAILTILTKLSRFESECALFEKKYGALIASWKMALKMYLQNMRSVEAV